MYENFLDFISKSANKFKEIDEPIRIISHLDSDGISSVSLLVLTLKYLNKKFIVSIIKQLTSKVLEELALESYKNIIFLDLCSTHIEEINSILKNKNIFVIDHHQIKEDKLNGILIHPNFYDIDGSSEVSSSGLTYLFCKSIYPEIKQYSYLAIVGAIGDIQEHKGFSGLNNLILEDCKENIEIKQGLRIFGTQSKPLFKALEYSTSMFIPGITGNEQAAIGFLSSLGIKLKDENGKFRKLTDLNKEEMHKLVTGIIIKRSAEKNPEDIIGNLYLLKNEPDDSALKDLREYSTLLNCCGRLHKPSLGIGVCLNDSNSKEQALELLTEYRFEIVKSLNWFYENKDNFIKGKDYFILNAGKNIRDTLIGIITTIISRSGLFGEDTIIISLANTSDNNTKISSRICGYNKEINLKEILGEICEKINCVAGGHKHAAGSLIPKDQEEGFIKETIDYFENRKL